jgi:hypothetical protein
MDFVLPFDLTLGCTVVTPGFTTCEVKRGDTLTALESVWSVMCMNEDIWDSLSSLARSSLSFLLLPLYVLPLTAASRVRRLACVLHAV